MERIVGKKKSGKSANGNKQRKTSLKNVSQDGVGSIASLLPLATPEQIRAAKGKFVAGVLTRGEAVRAGRVLPPSATHEIVGVDEDGTLNLVRRRFSLVAPKRSVAKKRKARKKT